MTAMIKMVGRGQPVPVSFQRSQLWPLLGISYRKCHHISSENSGKLKIMFFGTDDFAVQSLARLHQEFHVGGGLGCVSGLELTCLPMRSLVTAVAKFGWANNLKMHTWPPDIDLIKQQQFDLGVVASFGKLVPRNIIESFPPGYDQCSRLTAAQIPRSCPCHSCHQERRPEDWHHHHEGQTTQV